MNSNWLAGIRRRRPPGERRILDVVRGGEAAAAKKMRTEELMKHIAEHATELQRCVDYERGGQAKIIAAFALELYNRSEFKRQEEEK